MTMRIEEAVIFTGAVTFSGTATLPSSCVGNTQITSTAAIDRTKLQQNANAVYDLSLLNARVWDAMQTLLPTTSANDDLGLYAGTWGTNSPAIKTSDLKALGATTRYCLFELIVPAEYDAEQSLTLRLHAGMETTVADTTATIDATIYKSDEAGLVGSDLCTTAATTINSLVLADVDFSITATGINPGDKLYARVAVAINDAATGTQVVGILGKAELLVDIRG